MEKAAICVAGLTSTIVAAFIAGAISPAPCDRLRAGDDHAPAAPRRRKGSRLMTDMHDAPVMIDLPFEGSAGGRVQVALADNGQAQIVRVDPNGDRRCRPCHRFDHASALTEAADILTTVKGRWMGVEGKILAAAVLLLDRQLGEAQAEIRVLKSQLKSPEPL